MALRVGLWVRAAEMQVRVGEDGGPFAPLGGCEFGREFGFGIVGENDFSAGDGDGVLGQAGGFDEFHRRRRNRDKNIRVQGFAGDEMGQRQGALSIALVLRARLRLEGGAEALIHHHAHGACERDGKFLLRSRVGHGGGKDTGGDYPGTNIHCSASPLCLVSVIAGRT